MHEHVRARLDDEHVKRRIERLFRDLDSCDRGDPMSGTRIRTVLLGAALSGVTDHERALAVGAAMDMHEELVRLQALAAEVDRVLAALAPLASRGLRTQAATVRDRLMRARELSRTDHTAEGGSGAWT